MSASSRVPPNEILTYLRPSARAIDLAIEVFPTPGGPANRRIRPRFGWAFVSLGFEPSSFEASAFASVASGGETEAAASVTGSVTLSRSPSAVFSGAASAGLRARSWRTARNSRILSFTSFRA